MPTTWSDYEGRRNAATCQSFVLNYFNDRIIFYTRELS